MTELPLPGTTTTLRARQRGAGLMPGDPLPEVRTSRRERLLLVLGAAFLVVAHLGLILARGNTLLELWQVGAWAAAAFVGHRVLNRHLPHRDPFLFPVVMFLSGWGLSLIDRLVPAWATRQTAWLIVALFALVGVVVAPGHLRWLSRYRYLWLTGGLALLLLTIVFGRNPALESGLRLWLGVPEVYFQPSELLKLAFVVFMASYLADNRALLDSTVQRVAPHIGPLRMPSARFLAPLLLVWGIGVTILVWQRDLGAAALFMVVFILMLYIASGRLSYVLVGAILFALAGVAAYNLFGVVRTRVDVWIDPWSYSDNQGFQIIQSLMAFANGGIFGQGPGQGSPTYIPVVHSDFIFAAIGEEWGIIGALAVTALIALVVMRGLRLAVVFQAYTFRSFLAAGISITLAAQSLLIMGGSLGLIPLTGITLPFLSYGGSSLLTSFIMVGLLLVISGE